METKLARIVNKGLAGEPEHIVFQIKENLQCVDFSQIKYVDENEGTIREVSLVDADLNQPEILHVLNAMGHECELSINENDEVTIYF
jgi:hypothetical protein